MKSAWHFTTDAKADDLPKHRANLHRIERDLFGTAEPSPIELPSSMCDK